MGLFTPFAYIKNQLATFNPNDIANLTFWTDFSDSSFYTTSGADITEVYSRVGGSISHTLNRVNTSNNFYTLAASLSNPSLNSARVTTRPTTYRASSWNTADNNAIVFGPKTDTTSHPDGTMFVVYNRGTISTTGYLISRYTGTTDRGVQYNLTTGAPQTNIIGYDQNSPAYQFYNTTNTANAILTRVNNGATSTIYNGSVQTDTGAKNDTQNRTTRQFHNLGLFGSPTTAGETTPANVQYCEIIIYNRVLTEAERNQVLLYLSIKWNIPIADADAAAFIAATGITNPTITSAINTLVVDLKFNNLWNSMYAIYPFVGGTANTHKYNLKDARDLDAAYRLSIPAGFTNNSSGMTSDNTNLADTFFVPSVVFPNNTSVAIGFYSPNVPTGQDKISMGCDALGTGLNIINRRYRTDQTYQGRAYQQLIQPATALANNLGLTTLSRNGANSLVMYYGATAVSTNTATESSTTRPNNNFAIGGLNGNFQRADQTFSFAFISDGLSAASVSNLSSIVQAFQTSLGRQV